MNMAWAPMDVWGKDHVSVQVTEDTGISFEVTKSQGEEHLPTMIASGGLPDAIFVYTLILFTSCTHKADSAWWETLPGPAYQVLVYSFDFCLG